MKPMRILVGDIGGTKTLLAMAPSGARPEAIVRYENRNYGRFEEVIADFLSRHPGTIDRACFGVAGPVVANRTQATNLPWVIDGAMLETNLGIPRVRLINDFFAVAAGIPELQADELVTLNPGQRDPEGPVAVLGAGTGLGEGFMVWSRDRYEIIPTEGGHTDFGPRNEQEIELLRYLLKRHPRVSYERILSGNGLIAVYEFLRDSAFAPESPEVTALMATEDPAAVVSRFGLEGKEPLCSRALDMFVSIYGSEAGNLALKILATGGVYVAGGIAPKIIQKLRGSRFIGAFTDKGRLSPLVASMPLHVVMNPNVGLLGAVAHARRL